MTLPVGPSVLDERKTLDITVNPATGVISTAHETPDAEPIPSNFSVSDPVVESDPAFEEFQRFAEPPSFVEHQPESIFSEAALKLGSQGDVFSDVFDNQTLLGFDKIFPGLAERERIKTSVMNATANAPWTTVATEIAAHTLGNAPVDIVISMVSGGFGVAGKALMAAKRLKGLKATARFKKNSAILERLAKGDAPKTKFFARQAHIAKVEFPEGLATGSITETYLQNRGKEGDTQDIMNASVMDAVGGVFFRSMLDSAWRVSKLGYSKFRPEYIKKASDDIAEVSSVKPEEAAEMLDNAMPKTDAELRGVKPKLDLPPRGKKAQSVKLSEKTKPADVEAPGEIKIREALSKKQLKHLDDVGKNATPARVKRGFEALLENPEEAGRLTDILNARSKSAGITLPEYFKAKGLKMEARDTISVLTKEGEMILTAPGRATSVADLHHEIGHIIRSDLDGKHLSDMEKFYGVEKGAAWTESAEERFADDVMDFLAGKKVETPRGVRRAIKAFVDWVKNVYGKAFGMPTTASRDDVFSRLFAEGVTPFATPTPIKEFAVAKQRADQGIKQLFSPNQPIKKKKKEITPDQTKEIDDARSKQTDDQREVAEQAADSIAGGTKIPHTPLGEKWQKLKKKFGKLLGTFNVSLSGQLRQLGPVGAKIADQFPQAAIDSARIKSVGENAYNDFLNTKGWDNEKMRVLADTKVKKTIGSKEVDESELWWVRKTLESMDGWNKAKTSVAENSAQEKLVTEGFIYKGKPVIISRDQLKQLQNGDFISAEGMELVEAIQAGYRASGLEANKMVRKLTGRDFVDAENYYYVSQSTAKGDEVSGEFEALTPDRESKTGRGAFHARVGDAALEEVHPIHNMNAYMNYVSETVAYAKPAKELSIFLDNGGPMIKSKLGSDYLESMQNLADILRGDRSVLGPTTDTSLSKAYSLSVISQLGANPSVILKQFSSAWTAAATGKLTNVDGKQINGGTLFRDALSMAKDPIKQTEIKKVEVEMDKVNDYFRQRRESRVRWVELDDIIGDLSIYERNGKLDVKELAKLAKKKGIKKIDAWIATLEKTTEGIQVADRAQIAAIWKQAKATVQSKSEGKAVDMDEVSRLAIEITQTSQPTQEVVTKSLNQMKRGIVNKALTQYTTQTRKIAEMADDAFTTWANVDKTNMSKKEKEKLRENLWNALLPLAIQTGYAAAVGTAAGGAVASIKDLAKSDKQMKRLEKRRDGLMVKFTHNLIQGTVGVAPVAGAPLSGLLVAITGGKPFGQTIPFFDQMQDMSEATHERSVRKFMKSVMQTLGTPSLVADPTATLTERATK